MLSNKDVRLFLYFWMGVGLLLVLALVWWGAASEFNRAVAVGASKMSPQSIRVEHSSGEIQLARDAAPGVTGQRVRADGMMLQAGLLVVMALVLATPGMPFWTRIGWVTGVIVLFLLLNMGTVAFVAWALEWGQGGSVVTAGRAQQLVTGVYLAAPFALAAVWCWRFWLPGLARGREQPSAR